MPSIIEMVVFDAPIDIRKSGITLYTILVEVSVKKLVRPVKKTFLSRPNILVFFTNSRLSFLNIHDKINHWFILS